MIWKLAPESLGRCTRANPSHKTYDAGMNDEKGKWTHAYTRTHTCTRAHASTKAHAGLQPLEMAPVAWPNFLIVFCNASHNFRIEAIFEFAKRQ